MDPQLKSLLTTALATIAGMIGTMAVAHGVVPEGDQAAFVNGLVAVLSAVAFAGVAWWKKQDHTPAAQIAAVNAAPNGVKVVANTPANAAAVQVNAPLNITPKGT